MLITVVSVIIILVATLYFYNQHKFKKVLLFPPKGNFVSVGDIKLHYISKGDGKPLVFIHGGILTGNDFEKVIDLAAAQGYHAISFDRPGYGYSQRYKDKKMTPIEQVVLIHDALTQLDVQKPIIAGHSWSGTMILAYALLYPDEISGIITLSAAAYKEGYPAANGDAISTIISIPIIGDFILNTLLFPLGKIMAEGMLKATFNPDPISPAYREDTFLFWLRPGQFKANREDVLAFAPAAEELHFRYKQIKVPMVIVVGEKDPFGVVEQAHRLNRDIPESKLIVIPHIGHMIPQCHPHRVMEAVYELNFLMHK